MKETELEALKEAVHWAPIREEEAVEAHTAASEERDAATRAARGAERTYRRAMVSLGYWRRIDGSWTKAV